jgi:sugar lactone lactonase YvrE
MNSKGVLFIANRGLNPSIDTLAAPRKALANRYNDDPLDCIGGVLNDVTADSKGGVYFTMGGHLYVTNGPALAAFDVQKNGSLTNQHEFAKLEAGGNGDGSTFDTAGRIYVSTNPGVQVIARDGKYLGLIPTPRGIISVAFSGPHRKTLYAVARDNTQNKDWIIAIQMIAQGPKGRAK